MNQRLLQIEGIVAKMAGVTIDEIHSHHRDKEFADARAMVWLIAREYMNYSYPLIGRLYNRDHTTVMSGVKRLQRHPMTKGILADLEGAHPELFAKEPEPGRPKRLEQWAIPSVNN